MFDNNRYLTCGVNREIPLMYQILMWEAIDRLKKQGQELDYLQVFELTQEQRGTRLVHSQERPEYRKEVFYPFVPGATQKVFVIDDGDHSTMLLALEY